MEPFTFDERDKLSKERKEQKINEIIAEERKVMFSCLVSIQHDSILLSFQHGRQSISFMAWGAQWLSRVQTGDARVASLSLTAGGVTVMYL